MRLFIVTSVVAAIAFAFLVAGCGGGGGAAGVASFSTATTTDTPSAENGAVAFARCMRSHGIPNWPDPGSNGMFDKAKLQQLGVTPSRLRAIEDQHCGHLLPVGPTPQESAQQARTRLADELSFARCMRSRGVSRFPDPTAQGDLSVEMVQAAGIDVRSAAVLHVVQACLPASHGGLTAAKVRDALSHAGG